MTTPFLDRPPAGWFVLDVMKAEARKSDWCALMIDVPPDDFRERRPGALRARECWVRIPGKHKNRDAAWDTLEDMMATRH